MVIFQVEKKTKKTLQNVLPSTDQNRLQIGAWFKTPIFFPPHVSAPVTG